MCLEELWSLFPILLVEPKACWTVWFFEEKASLDRLLQGKNIRVHHIGSTAVSRIKAKSIVDILIETERIVDMRNIACLLAANGYIIMSETKDRISLNKGYTEKGFAERVFHLHLRLLGDNDELYFRDYLQENPLIAKEYEAMKIVLAEKYKNDRDGYTQAKTEFVLKYTALAKEKYGKRY